MKLRHAMISLALVMAAGCDTMEQDADGQMLSINNQPAYLLPGTDGVIDLAARVVSPGKIRVEITGSTRKGVLTDMGKGLLRYAPSKGSTHDSFQFRVFSADNQILGEDSIGIIIPGDTLTLPCAVYTRADTVRNVTGPVTVDVAANDYACSASLTISIQVPPEEGTATIVGNKVQYTPGSSFPGTDRLMYKAVSSDPSMEPGYGFLRIFGPDTLSGPTEPNPPTDSTACVAKPFDDLFYKPLNDTAIMYLDVLANDSICSDTSLYITRNARFGNAYVDLVRRKIGYRNFPASNSDDTLFYMINSSPNTTARVIIKRQ